MYLTLQIPCLFNLFCFFGSISMVPKRYEHLVNFTYLRLLIYIAFCKPCRSNGYCPLNNSTDQLCDDIRVFCAANASCLSINNFCVKSRGCLNLGMFFQVYFCSKCPLITQVAKQRDCAHHLQTFL